jgi:hypothetical protein
MITLRILLLVALSAPLASAVEVLVTQNSNLIQWTCFDAASPDACCQEIEATLGRFEAPSPQFHDCQKLVADVPHVPTLEKYKVAQYSLILSHMSSDSTTAPQQHRWAEQQWTLQEPITSPFVWEPTETNSPSLNLKSTLSQEGGMHRLMTSSLQRTPNESGFYYLLMTVPEGMFVDLDDFLAHSTATVYSAKVCDIEKTAFVSGQHVVIVQVPAETDMEISSKWHIRYPMPQNGGEEWIRNLPQPQLLHWNGQELFHIQDFSSMPDIWVAAGYEQDYDIVMWGTVAACWVGVWIMLHDIASVSYWDP